ncbi:uncharacterized protein N7529_005641 [Penicillium soppii]|uniref:uncharacterized protein n=1 Tax=Penicillium soppii TaxID=69789 RepID=UPI002548429D|nr:uncharacterized protein N7529_005641 [Penicillium soppii]KAJ5863725.1 hypothetical protein N7529_005641 [Penicillium soppii]
MANTADVIILSSSPIAPHPPGPDRRDENVASELSPRDTTPTPTSSTVTKSQTRSRFFPTPVASDKDPKTAKQHKKRTTKKTAVSKTDDQDVPKKSQGKAKKGTTEPVAIAQKDPSVVPVNPKGDGAKPTRGRPRKTAKGKEPVNKTLAGKITKASGDLPPKKSAKSARKVTGTRSPPPEDVAKQSGLKEPIALGKDEVLHLDEATRRRLDWTPPRDTACEGIAPVEAGDNVNEGYGLDTTAGFGKLLSDYNYLGIASNPHDLVQNSNAGGPTKRRRIDLVDHQVQSMPNGKSGSTEQSSAQGEEDAGKPKKTTKSKPKKFTTLTARMTAQYAANDAEEDGSTIDCTPDKRTTKSRRSKAKKLAEEPAFTILSPEAAVDFVNNQDLMFGTCSQLEREDSPQTLREMQEAIRASESLSYSVGTRDPNSNPATQEPSIRSVSRVAGTRNLWCIAARDTEGSLIQSKALNVVDLTDLAESTPQKSSDKVDKALHRPLPKDWFEHEFSDIDSPPEKRPVSSILSGKASVSAPQCPAPAPAPAQAVALEPESTITATITKPVKKAANPPIEVVNNKPADSQALQMPQYTGFTDAELSKQIAAFGFKAVRGRKKMIDLLQQCWESKHGSNASRQIGEQAASVPGKNGNPKLASDPMPKAKVKPKYGAATNAKKSAETISSTSTFRTNLQASPSKSSGGKPTTRTSTSLIDVEEIQDSEEEITPSPSQVQKHYNAIYSKKKGGSRVPEHSLNILTKSPPPSPTNPKVVSSTTRVTKESSSASIKTSRTTKFPEQVSLADISAQITKAVRVQPRLSPLSSSLGSRRKLTWHERILMYDPIVLEDFTAWLNIEGLGLVGEDREIGTGSVREWCESKGICCCWKKNASW